MQKFFGQNHFFSILMSLFSNIAHGDEGTGLRTIIDMGCNKDDGGCYIHIDGDAVGETYGCESNVIKWDTNEQGGKNLLAIFMSAFLSQKQIHLNISGCYNGHPTFSGGSMK